MKRLIILIISLFMGFAVFAQPTITRINNLAIGDQYSSRVILTEINNALLTEGPNQTWDFSNVQTENTSETAVCVDPASTPFADSAEVALSNIAIQTAGNVATDTLVYQFLNVTNDKCEMIALGISAPTENLNYSKWIDPMIAMKLPFTYGDSYNDQYIMWMNFIYQNTIVLKDTSTALVSAVGYGTVITPAGTFENALMVKKIINWVWWNNYADFNYKTEGTDIEYEWFVPGIKIPVINIYFAESDELGMGTYISQTEMTEGGIGDGDGGNGDGNDGDGGDSGDGGGVEPYDPAGVWLNVASAGGGLYEKSNGSLSWTLGETITETHEKSAEILTQGFRQPVEFLTSVIQPEENFEVRIYPNPFSTEITLQIDGFSEKINAEIYSATGQIMKNFIVDRHVFQLNMKGNKSGIYYLRVLGEQPKTFTIIKQ